MCYRNSLGEAKYITGLWWKIMISYFQMKLCIRTSVLSSVTEKKHILCAHWHFLSRQRTLSTDTLIWHEIWSNQERRLDLTFVRKRSRLKTLKGSLTTWVWAVFFFYEKSGQCYYLEVNYLSRIGIRHELQAYVLRSIQQHFKLLVEERQNDMD